MERQFSPRVVTFFLKLFILWIQISKNSLCSWISFFGWVFTKQITVSYLLILFLLPHYAIESVNETSPHVWKIRSRSPNSAIHTWFHSPSRAWINSKCISRVIDLTKHWNISSIFRFLSYSCRFKKQQKSPQQHYLISQWLLKTFQNDISHSLLCYFEAFVVPVAHTTCSAEKDEKSGPNNGKLAFDNH